MSKNGKRAWHVVPQVIIIGGILLGSSSSIDPEKLHKDALVVDLHSDTVLRMKKGFDFSARDTSGQMDIPRLQEGGVDLQVFACWIPGNTPPDTCRARTDLMIDSLYEQVDRNPDKIGICRTAAEAEQIVASGRIAAFIGIENGLAIANNLNNLGHYCDRGVRYITLTHTSSHDWCISSADTAPKFDGLTSFGEDVVREMNRLGMIIDISHAGPSAVARVLAISADPVIASHSCVHALCPHDRNLTDDQIKGIAKNGGMIGINFFSGYLDERFNEISDSIKAEYKAEIDSIEAQYPNDYAGKHKALAWLFEILDQRQSKLDITIGTVVDHIDYIVRLVGPDHVGLGSDFDGVFAFPRGLNDCSKMPAITRELVSRGYSETNIRKILGGNFMRVFRQVCDN
jgi:membrane dipeptidase